MWSSFPYGGSTYVAVAVAVAGQEEGSEDLEGGGHASIIAPTHAPRSWSRSGRMQTQTRDASCWGYMNREMLPLHILFGPSSSINSYLIVQRSRSLSLTHTHCMIS